MGPIDSYLDTKWCEADKDGYYCHDKNCFFPEEELMLASSKL